MAHEHDHQSGNAATRSLLVDPDAVRSRAEGIAGKSLGIEGQLAQDVIMLLDEVERLRVALQDVQGIALNGTEAGDTEADRLFAIDHRVTEELA